MMYNQFSASLRWHAHRYLRKIWALEKLGPGKGLRYGPHAGLNWYRANFSVEQFAMTTVPKVPKLKLPVLGIFSTEDKFLTEEQMTASVK